MKKYILCIALSVLIFSTSFAQEDKQNDEEIRTIFGSLKSTSHGGYGAFSTGYARFNGRDGSISGGRGAWIINHNLNIGGAGYGFHNETEKDPVLHQSYRLDGGYGGFLVEPALKAKKPVHLTFPVLIGAGGIAYTQKSSKKSAEEDLTLAEDRDAFFIVEPGIELEFNIVQFLRIGCGAHYRYTSGITLKYSDSESGRRIVDEKVLHGFSFNICFKFGKF